MATMNIEFPNELAADAERVGLFTPEAIIAMLRERVREQAIADLRVHLESMQGDPTPPMAPNALDALIAEVRAERRRANRP